MSSSGDDAPIREAFREAEAVRDQLIVRVMQGDASLIASYLLALAMGSLGGILEALGINKEMQKRILKYLIVERWLAEGSLKYLIFALFLIQGNTETVRLPGGLRSIFGNYVDIAKARAAELADEFIELLIQEQSDPTNAAIDERQQEVYMLAFTASDDVEQQHRHYLPKRVTQKARSNSSPANVSDTFHIAEAVKNKLKKRTEQALERDGRQITEDLQEFTKHGLVGLLVRIPLDRAEIEALLRYDIVKQWLTEVCLKHLMFLLYLGHKDDIVKTLSRGLSHLFGEKYINAITAQAQKLTLEAGRVMIQDLRRNPGMEVMPQRMSEIISLSLTASEHLEKQRLQFISKQTATKGGTKASPVLTQRKPQVRTEDIDPEPAKWLIRYDHENEIIQYFLEDYLRPLQFQTKADNMITVTNWIPGFFSDESKRPQVKNPIHLLEPLLYRVERTGNWESNIPVEVLYGFSNSGYGYYTVLEKNRDSLRYLCTSFGTHAGVTVEQTRLRGSKWQVEQLENFLRTLRYVMFLLAENPLLLNGITSTTLDPQHSIDRLPPQMRLARRR